MARPWIRRRLRRPPTVVATTRGRVTRRAPGLNPVLPLRWRRGRAPMWSTWWKSEKGRGDDVLGAAPLSGAREVASHGGTGCRGGVAGGVRAACRLPYVGHPGPDAHPLRERYAVGFSQPGGARSGDLRLPGAAGGLPGGIVPHQPATGARPFLRTVSLLSGGD